MTQQLLARHGVLTRESLNIEAVPGGFGLIYPVLKGLEENGRIRRGYFVAGLGATQFALPGALDLLRSLREKPDDPEIAVLAATDPANPYGATLKWPAFAPGGASTAAEGRRGKPAHHSSAEAGMNSAGRSRAVARGRMSGREGGTRAHAIGRRHGHSRQRRPGGVPGARRSPARHLPARVGARAIEDRPRHRARAHRPRPHGRRVATRHAHRGDRRRPASDASDREVAGRSRIRQRRAGAAGETPPSSVPGRQSSVASRQSSVRSRQSSVEVVCLQSLRTTIPR